MNGRDNSLMAPGTFTDEFAFLERIFLECMQRHPVWISRLETADYYPVAQIPIHDLNRGDIVDVREFKLHIEESNAFMTVRDIRCDGSTDNDVCDGRGVYSITGELPNGQILTIEGKDGFPIRRRKVVRFARRVAI